MVEEDHWNECVSQAVLHPAVHVTICRSTSREEEKKLRNLLPYVGKPLANDFAKNAPEDEPISGNCCWKCFRDVHGLLICAVVRQ